MNENFISMICEMIGNDEPRAAESVEQVVREFVVPKILKPYQERENGHISDDFMKLMANYGFYIFEEDRRNGPVLFEIAMQRISRGCVIHKRRSELEELPLWAQNYTAKYDIPMPMSVACFAFLLGQAEKVLVNTTPLLRSHMETILFGIISNLTETGEELYANTLDKNVSAPIVYLIAWRTIQDKLNPDDVDWQLATPDGIIKYNDYFRARWNKLNKKALIMKLAISGCFKTRKLKKMIFYDLPTYGNMFGF